MNVLITGESGTGKELYAHSIHNESSRRDSPFIPIKLRKLSNRIFLKASCSDIRTDALLQARKRAGSSESLKKQTAVLFFWMK